MSKPNPAEPALDRAGRANPREYRQAFLANRRRSDAQRPDPITSAHNRSNFGVETGPWIGRVPTGWTVAELARFRSGPGQTDLFFMREGSLLLFPSGLIWFDHANLGFVAPSWVGRDAMEEVTDTDLPRSQRRVLTTIRLGLWTFTVGHEAFGRLQLAWGAISPDGAEDDYMALKTVLQELLQR
jgi:hypothetical protein